ncbi:voltage-dependent anion channel [Chaetomium strumarium]|uniref:Voltage-dependent anion channel n=1 Tax=Chaetomium strumarium TaxID=1170767 RepID=A0AAJ0GQL0_9PEZI|nr:voltage-dependent anion channel [Chaetomium strumarium]
MRAGTDKTKVGLRDRIACFQWTWFTMTMATGGIANVLHSIPYKSQWLTGVGLAFFFLNLCLFVMNCICITLRFRWRPGSLVESFTDQRESLLATILITITQYGTPHVGPWLLSVVEALFWLYVGVSILISASLYLTLWSTQVFPIHTMTPVWVFPAYPLLLTAPFGGNLIAAAHNTGRLGRINAVPVTLAAVTVQGTGYLISFMVCAAFLYRLMTQKLPRDHQRPGVFISVGPSGFTCAGLVQLGSLSAAVFADADADYDYFMGSEQQHAVHILRLLAYMTGLWLWGLSVWFFLVSVGSLWKYLRPEGKGKLRFQMTWFSFVFPNTALVTATEVLGTAFDSPGLKIFGCVLTVFLVLVWLLVFTKMLRCLWSREL